MLLASTLVRLALISGLVLRDPMRPRRFVAPAALGDHLVPLTGADLPAFGLRKV